ncbi:helix-turn-helix transcriptional regulator [Streptococcus suis]|uniref:helix-turn-helix transcriptional regulator n=1 Tax=Streptococcus suis TaxID=1307 RepID=UPI003AF6A0E4
MIKCLQEQSDSVASAISLTASIYQFLSVLSSQISKLSHLENKLVNPIIVNVLDYLIKNFNKPISIQDISDSLVFNRSYLSKTFKQSMNISLKEYLTNLRTTYASELLSTTTIPIERISSLCGFNNHDVFTRAFKKKYGQTPLSLRKFHQQRSSAADNENDLYQLLKNFPLVE